MNEAQTIPGILVCPCCHNSLVQLDVGLHCDACGVTYRSDGNGFLNLVLDETLEDIVSTTDKHAEGQLSKGAFRTDEEYLLPYLSQESRSQRVLDAGCGLGRLVWRFIAEGYDAYGIDLPALSDFWAQSGNDRNRFFCCDAAHMPFADSSFDTVISMGVIEHIGTISGHCSLKAGYREERKAFAEELLRITRPGGRIMIACPNKRFPFDLQHRAVDDQCPWTTWSRAREKMFAKTGLNPHRVSGHYHLLSYSEVTKLFCDNNDNSIKPLPLKAYFGLSVFRRGIFRPFARLAELYINNMPSLIRTTFLNPYVLVEIKKASGGR